MKLRQRVVSRGRHDELDESDESSEDDSDESDNWVMPNSRKNRSVKRKKMTPAHLNSLKKQHTSEAVTLVYNILFASQIPPLMFTTHPLTHLCTSYCICSHTKALSQSQICICNW
jgi:hypothetical protein